MSAKNENIPKHIGIIMDGNGRWAKKRLLPRNLGHKQGAKTFQTIIEHCRDIGVSCVTAYAFSTENWKRPAGEIAGILKLLKEYLKDSFDYEKTKIKVQFIGDISVLDAESQNLVTQIEEECEERTDLMTLNIAFNYGGRQEIVTGVKEIASLVREGRINPEEITEKTIESHLYTKNCPPLDFILRPSGEFRLSNFLIWQSAYAEFIYTDILWPDFTTDNLDEAIQEFNRRNRRFGGL